MSNEVERIGEPRSDVLYRSGSVNKWAWNGGGGESSDANSGVVRERRLDKDVTRKLEATRRRETAILDGLWKS